MATLLTTCVILLFVLLLFNGVIDAATGAGKVNFYGVIEGTITVVFLYWVIISCYGMGSVNYNGIPFMDKLETYGSISNMFHEGMPDFLLECTELISMTFLMALISRLVPAGFGGTGITRSLIRSVVIVLAGILFNQAVLSVAEKNEIFGWAVTALRCFLTGGALLITPAVLIGSLLHLNSNSAVVLYLLEQLPQTAIGRAFSTAVTNSLVLVFSIMLVESQFGSLLSIVSGASQLIALGGVFVLIALGIKLITRTL